MDWSTTDILLFGADVDEFRLEKNIRPEKSLEEIEKLYVDESLPTFERAVLLSTSSYDVQKEWAIDQTLPLLKTRRQDTLANLVPNVLDSLQSNSTKLHKTGSHMFASVAKEKAVEPSVFASTFLPTLLTCFENKNPEISTIWFNTLLEIIPTLPTDVIKNKILATVRTKGQLSQPISSRQTCCRIIGKMAKSLEPSWVQQELMSLVKSLAQDVDSDVRETMCGELKHLGKSFNKEFCSTFILPEVVELSQDEEAGVRCVAMETIVELLPFLDERSLEETVVRLVLRLLHEAEASRDMKLRKKAAEVIGHFAHGLKGYLTHDQSSQILDLYISLSQTQSVGSDNKLNPSTQTEGQTTTSSISVVAPSNSLNEFTPVIEDDDKAECRRLCAYNMPAMMVFADRLKETSKLFDVIKSLSTDKHFKVRRTLACGIHEVISILGEKSLLLMKDYATQLQDDRIEVLLGIVEHIPEVVEVLAVANNLDPKTRQPGLTELIQPLLHFEQVASACRHQWRLHSNLLDSLSCLTRCMTSDQLYTKFVPLCWKCIGRNDGSFSPVETTSRGYALPVKLAASRTLCTFIKYIRKFDQRREICSQLILDCARNESHKQRLLFVSICQIILENFSRHFFKEQGFYFALLNLANDPLSNVRLKVCSLLSQLKTILLLPSDREYQQLFESTISSLLMDKDSETIAAVNCAVKDMDRINYRIQSMISHSLLEEDIIDKEREEEEQQLLKEEEYDKEKEREGIVMKLSSDFRRSAPPGGTRTGGGSGGGSAQQSPSISRAGGGGGGTKKGSGPGGASVSSVVTSSKKPPGGSPGIPRKNSNQGLVSTPSTSPSTTRPNVRVTSNASSSVASSSTKKQQMRSGVTSTDGGIGSDDRGSSTKGRRSAGSSPSLSPNTTVSSSPGQAHRSKSREHLSTSSTSKSSPGQTSRKPGGGTGGYGLTYANKAPPQRGASSFN